MTGMQDPEATLPRRRRADDAAAAEAPASPAAKGGESHADEEEASAARSTVSDHASEQLRAVALFDDRGAEVKRGRSPPRVGRGGKVCVCVLCVHVCTLLPSQCKHNTNRLALGVPGRGEAL